MSKVTSEKVFIELPPCGFDFQYLWLWPIYTINYRAWRSIIDGVEIASLSYGLYFKLATIVIFRS